MRRRSARADGGCRDDSARVTELYAALADTRDPGLADELAALVDRQWCRAGCGPCHATWLADARGRLRSEGRDVAAALYRRAAGGASEPSNVARLAPRGLR